MILCYHFRARNKIWKEHTQIGCRLPVCAISIGGYRAHSMQWNSWSQESFAKICQRTVGVYWRLADTAMADGKPPITASSPLKFCSLGPDYRDAFIQSIAALIWFTSYWLLTTVHLLLKFPCGVPWRLSHHGGYSTITKYTPRGHF